MCNTTAAVRLAQRRVCRLMRGRPPNIRARLPFDPSDQDDVEVWIFDRIREREWSGEETVPYIVRWILWQAENAGRGRSVPTFAFSRDGPEVTREVLKVPRLVDVPSSAGISGLHSRETFEDKLREQEAAEEMVACIVAAIRETCAMGTSHSAQSAIAALSCVARVIHAVKSTLTPPSVRYVIHELFVHPAFRALSIPSHIRGRFRDAMVRLEVTGSFRRDLTAVGWSCPGHQQWTDFTSALAAECNNRFL